MGSYPVPAVRRTVFLIALVALLSRLPLTVMVARHPERSWANDTASYIRPAMNLLAGHGFSQSETAPFVPEVFRTPTYPVFLSGLFAVARHSPLPAFAGQAPRTVTGRATPFAVTSRSHLVIVIVQIVSSALTAGLVYLIGRSLLGDRAATMAGLLFAFSLGPMVYSVLILTETLFTLLLLSWMATLQRTGAPLDRRRAMVVGLLGGVIVLCRPIAVLLPLLGAALIVASDQGRSARRLAVALLLILTTTAVVTPWLARNQRLLGYGSLSTTAPYNLLYYNACSLVADQFDTPLDRVRADMRDRVEAELSRASSVFDERGVDGQMLSTHARMRRDEAHPLAATTALEATRARIWGSIAREALMQDPWCYARLHLKDNLASLLPNVTELLELCGVTRGGQGTLAVLNRQGVLAAVRHYFGGELWPLWLAAPWIATLGITYAGAIAGVLTLLRRRSFYSLAFLLMPTLYLLILPGAAAHPRFRVPVMPFVCLLAGLGLATLWRVVTERRRCQ